MRSKKLPSSWVASSISYAFRNLKWKKREVPISASLKILNPTMHEIMLQRKSKDSGQQDCNPIGQYSDVFSIKKK
jgi:hypothetical protein